MSSLLSLLYVVLASSTVTLMSTTAYQRLRARFTGQSPPPLEASKQQAQDMDTLQKAVASAIAVALSNDEFTKAVAKHLAVELQPSLKSATDSSTIEANILASNEQLSQRIEETNTATTGKLTALDEAVSEIKKSLAELETNLKSVQEQVTSPDTSVLTAHGEKLDTISTGLQSLQTEGPAPVTTALSSQTEKLDAITAELALLKENAEINAALTNISSEIASVKSEIEASNSTGFSGLNTHATTIIAAIEAQNAPLAEIKESANKTADILAAVEASNGSIQTLGASVDELKTAVSALPPAAEKVDLAPLTSTLDAHTAHLTDIKGLVATPPASPAAPPVDISSLESSVAQLNTTLESHTGHLTDIKGVVAAPAPAAEKLDLSGIEASVQEIKDLVAAIPAPVAGKDDEILASVAAIKTLVQGLPTPVAQKDVKDDEILAELKSAEKQILSEVLLIKGLVQTKKTVVSVAEVGDSDKGAEVHTSGSANPPAEAEVQTNGNPKAAMVEDAVDASEAPEAAAA